jgi:hypothetical protein
MKPKSARTPSQAISVRLAGFAVVVAASLAALLPAAAAATTRTAISFNNTRHVVSGRDGRGNTFYTVSSGTSVASGAITGSFALVDSSTVRQTSPKKNGHFGTIRINSLLTGDHGTIRIHMHGQFVSSNPNGTETIRGHWTIVGGTGRYTDLLGNGTDDTTIKTATETITDTFTGFAYQPGS